MCLMSAKIRSKSGSTYMQLCHYDARTVFVQNSFDRVYRQYYLARLEFPLIYWAFESAPFINFNCISLGRSAPSWERIISSLLQAQYLDMASPCACGWRSVCKAFLIFTFSSRATMLYPLVHKPIIQLYSWNLNCYVKNIHFDICLHYMFTLLLLISCISFFKEWKK